MTQESATTPATAAIELFRFDSGQGGVVACTPDYRLPRETDPLNRRFAVVVPPGASVTAAFAVLGMVVRQGHAREPQAFGVMLLEQDWSVSTQKESVHLGTLRGARVYFFDTLVEDRKREYGLCVRQANYGLRGKALADSFFETIDGVQSAIREHRASVERMKDTFRLV
jgi:hypothetical protein